MTTKVREARAFAVWLLIALVVAITYLALIVNLIGNGLGMAGGAYLGEVAMILALAGTYFHDRSSRAYLVS